MNKRSLHSGLPTKPYIPEAQPHVRAAGPGLGPAPPLPAGPPPQQQQQYQSQEHAAAWAAYYQSQGYTAPAGPQQPQPQPSPVAGAPVAAANPYANYGYGAGAQHASAQYQPQQPAPGPGPGPIAGPSQPNRPPPNTQAYATTSTQPSLGGPANAYGQQSYGVGAGAGAQQAYNPQAPAAGVGAGYRPPQAGVQQQQHRPPYQTQQQQQNHGFGWGSPQQQGPITPQQQQQQPYRPPVQPTQGYNTPSQPQQPYYPQQQGYTPTTPQHQPYQPSPTPPARQQPFRPPGQHRPPRPPMANATPTGPAAGFPPAKRPRFDGPGGMGHNVGSSGVGNMNNSSPVRPPAGLGHSVRPPAPVISGPGAAFGAGGVGVGVGAQQGFHVGLGPGVAGGAGRGGAPVGPARGGTPHLPASRPPIHLGVGVPTGPARGGASVRGGMAERGGASGRGGRGMSNAPRGPSGMGVRRPADGSGQGQSRSSVPPRRGDTRQEREKDKEREKERKRKEKEKEREKEKELKTTMTDFRIVGIEIKALDWSWGKTGQDEEENKDGVSVKKEESTSALAEGPAATQEEGNNDGVSVGVDGAAAVEEGRTAEIEVKTEVEAGGEGPQVEILENGTTTPAVAIENPGETAATEEKRGEKRKAKSPDADDQGLTKKRPSSNYTLTHNKPNPALSAHAPASSDRFRIYFDSPPELDRIPKAARGGRNAARAGAGGKTPGSTPAPGLNEEGRNSNKRGRRESSSVAPSVGGGAAVAVEEEAAEGSGEGLGDPADSQTRAQGPNQSADSTGVNGETPTVDNAAGENEVAQETTSAVEPRAGDVAESSDQAQAAAESNEQTTLPDASEANGEVGDVSMLTDPGQIAAAIDELVQAAAAEAEEPLLAEELGAEQQQAESAEPVESGHEQREGADGAEGGEVEDAVDAALSVAAEEPQEQEQGQESASTLTLPADAGTSDKATVVIAPESDPVNDGEPTIPADTTGPEPTAAVPVLVPAQAKSTNTDQPKAGAGGKTTPESAEEVAAALAASASNTASAYQSRAQHHPSASPSASTSNLPGISTSTSAVKEEEKEKEEWGIEEPSTNRISVLYEHSSRRMCFDAEIVDKVRVWRGEGRIEVVLRLLERSKDDEGKGKGKTGEEEEDGDGDGQREGGVEDDPEAVEEVKEDTVEEPRLPRGILIESYDPVDQRFVSLSHSQLEATWSALSSSDADADAQPNKQRSTSRSSPPFHLAPIATASQHESEDKDKDEQAGEAEAGEDNSSKMVLTVYLNKRNPLSEPKWCRNNSADAWLVEQFGGGGGGGGSGSKAGARGEGGMGWKGKLEIMDPDPAPTLRSIIESWSTTATMSTPLIRKEFVRSLLDSTRDQFEILLRLTRGDRNPPASSSSSSSSSTASASASAPAPASASGPASKTDPDPYASHQTHVSLAILAMYRLTTSYAVKCHEEGAMHEAVRDIVAGLPAGMVSRSLDGMFREWLAARK